LPPSTGICAAVVFANSGPQVSAASSATSADVKFRGPRYLFINANYLCPVVHGERYFYMDKVARHPNVPDTWVQPTTIWYNYKLLSRQRHGIISPSNNTQTFVG